jgi:hypothetical protein
MKSREELEKELYFLQSALSVMIKKQYDKPEDPAETMFYMESFRSKCEQISQRIAEIEWILTASEKDWS